jgi:hypothetical protein
VATLLADSPTAPEQQAEGPAGTSSPPSPPPKQGGYAVGCAKCGAPMAGGQDWCLQCGNAASGSIGSQGWRPALWVLVGTVVLVLGAAAAGYAALNKSRAKAPLVTTTVARVTPPASVVPSTTVPTTTLPITPTKPIKIPKIPLKAVTPPPAKTTPTTTTPTTSEPSTGGSTATGTGGASTEPKAILLDNNAVSTYNPYNLPASDFGDPSLTIDGESSTAWTAEVEPSTAPKLAEGLVIDLKSSQKLSALKLVTATPGMTVQVFGSKTSTPPSSITSPEWVALSRSIVVRKRHTRIGLLHQKQAYTLVTLWISKAPASAVGTPAAPGHVSVNELELFPAS